MSKHKNSDSLTPIGLTVHSMPTPESTLMESAQRTRKGRKWLLLIVLVSAAPVIASYLTYYVIRPQSTKSYGQLISPQRDLPALQATNLEGGSVDLRTLQGQWLLVTVADAACDADCEKHLYLLRQLHIGMGADRLKMDRVWLVTGNQPIPDRLLPGLEGTTVLRVDASALGKWLDAESGHELKDHLYLVDPLGHWMMRFPPKTDLSAATQIKHNLVRLMRAANSWDRAGR